MATINRTREAERSLKKSYSVSSVTLTPEDITADLDVLEMFHIPRNSIVTDVNAIIKTSFNPGVALTVEGDLGTTIVMNALDIAAAPGVQTPSVLKANTDTGDFFTLEIALAGGLPTVGEVEIIVEYIEYTKNNGELTQLSTGG